MTTYDWSGGVGSPMFWSDPGAWTPSGAPSAGDQATIVAPSGGDVQVLGDGGADLLTLGGAVELTAGAFSFGAITETDGASLTVQAAATLTTLASGGFSGDYVAGALGALTSFGTVAIGGALRDAPGHGVTVYAGTFTVGSVVPGAADVGAGAGAFYAIYGGVFLDQGDFSGANDTIAVGAPGLPAESSSPPLASFTVAGTATLGGDMISAVNASTVTLANVVNTPGNDDNVFAVLDATSWIELGAAQHATGGEFVLDAGQSLIGGGEIAAPQIVIDGLLETADVQELDGAISGAGRLKIDADSSLTLNGAVDASAGLGLVFAGPDALLSLNAAAYGGASGFAPVISGFQLNDGVDLVGIDGGAVRLIGADKVEVDVGGAPVTVLSFAPGTDLSQIEAQSDGAGGTLLSIPCFCAGVRILTPDGERAVESLAAGDLVSTVDGAARPILWLGRRVVSARFADPTRCWPIRVMAGALGENTPSRDLLVSPDHALLVAGLLVQAGALVNGRTILRETRVAERFVYYHLELEGHELIFAEGAPAETFIDNQDRMAFDNWREHEALWPQGRALPEMAAPRVKSARQLPTDLRRLLAARAATDVAEAVAI